jgi:hypothetical protein
MFKPLAALSPNTAVKNRLAVVVSAVRMSALGTAAKYATLHSMYKIATRSNDAGADLLIVLTGSWFKACQRLFCMPGRVTTDLDLIHDVKAILVPLIGESDPDQRVHQTIRIACCSCKRIAEVGTGVGNGGVASEDYQTGYTDAVGNCISRISFNT